MSRIGLLSRSRRTSPKSIVFWLVPERHTVPGYIRYPLRAQAKEPAVLRLRQAGHGVRSAASIWGERWDSNPRRPESQSGALPTELRPPSSNHSPARAQVARPAGNTPLPSMAGASGRLIAVQKSLPAIFVEPAIPNRSVFAASRPAVFAQVARPAGLEPATLGLEGRCSIQLSYGRKPRRTVTCEW